MWWRSVIWTGVLFGTFAWIIPNVLWLLSWLVGKLFAYRVSYAPFGWTALGILLLIWGCLFYGHYLGRFSIEVNHVEYASQDVPKAFDGYKVDDPRSKPLEGRGFAKVIRSDNTLWPHSCSTGTTLRVVIGKLLVQRM